MRVFYQSDIFAQLVMNGFLAQHGTVVHFPYGVQDCEAALLTLHVTYIDRYLLEFRHDQRGTGLAQVSKRVRVTNYQGLGKFVNALG